MNVKDIKDYLNELKLIPEHDSEVERYFKMDGFLDFLINSQEGMVPIYLSYDEFFIYSVSFPVTKLTGNYIKDLLNWNHILSSGYSYSDSDSELIFETMSSSSPSILKNSTPFFFLRECFSHTALKVEINQKVSHLLELCWSKKQNSFVKINEVGDYIDIATMQHDDDLILCTLRKKDLDCYLYRTKSVLIRFFDVIRCADDCSPTGNRTDVRQCSHENEIFANLTRECYDNGNISRSYLHGFQIIRNKIPNEQMKNRLRGNDRKYESFIIFDWKHGKLGERNSNPKKIGNYFVDSNLPFETSPAFFRSEILAKYKHDPEKYTLEHRRIYCRGAWSIRYGINDEGQVFAYIKDLSHLPFTEQQYWKSFNEKPKAGIPESVLKTDFEGEWNLDYDPLISLKNMLETFPHAKFKGENVSIWKMPKVPPTKDIKFLNYVVTDSTKEWEDQISVLNQILIEGFQSKTIKSIAKHLNCVEKGFGSIKQINRCLETLDVDKEEVDTIVSPLFELIHLRKIVVHTIDEPYPDEDLKIHYKNLIEKCDKSMRKLTELIEKGLFNITEEPL